jgi:glutamate synthase (NADPH/NADH) large chain/glutamate synthase (ferredoxin)
VLDGAFDHRHLLHAARAAFDGETKVKLDLKVTNRDRTVGTLLSSAIARLRGPEGLPDGSIEVDLKGSAGQSFGAWLASGVTMSLEGEANDYCGKGLSGGGLSIRPPRASHLRAEDNVVVGNVALYGATSGRAFFNGLAGERFAIRNSGAEAVVEGVGDHGCEYMTGGRVVVLGSVGLNFAAGMSGGIAYVLDADNRLSEHLNRDLVDMEDLEVEDRAALRVLLEEHHERTDSSRASEVLSNWEEWLPRFVRVMPRDYKRVLEEGRTATQDLSTNEQLAVTPS